MSRGGEFIDRVSIEALDAILGHRFPVLDDGYVRVIDYMGGDSAVVQAARVSYGQGTKRYHQDSGLIRYLMRHRHTTPLEMCEIKLHIRTPMDCWRQWIRHRTASVNEYSTRYSVAIDAAQRTGVSAWRLQEPGNRQGSRGNVRQERGTWLSRREREVQSLSREVYQERIGAGVAREQARKDLPLSTYTEAYWKINLHNLLHFLTLRMSYQAQYEIRQYALTIGHQIVAKWVPIVWNAFLDYRLNAIEFSAPELTVLTGLLNSFDEGREAAIAVGFLLPDGSPSSRRRELDEFDRKLERLGIRGPWSS